VTRSPTTKKGKSVLQHSPRFYYGADPDTHLRWRSGKPLAMWSTSPRHDFNPPFFPEWRPLDARPSEFIRGAIVSKRDFTKAIVDEFETELKKNLPPVPAYQGRTSATGCRVYAWQFAPEPHFLLRPSQHRARRDFFCGVGMESQGQWPPDVCRACLGYSGGTSPARQSC